MDRIFQRVVENVGVHADQLTDERPLVTVVHVIYSVVRTTRDTACKLYADTEQ